MDPGVWFEGGSKSIELSLDICCMCLGDFTVGFGALFVLKACGFSLVFGGGERCWSKLSCFENPFKLLVESLDLRFVCSPK